MGSESKYCEKSGPLAFDLQSELDWVRRLGEDYKPYFLENAGFYAKELYGRLQISPVFEHVVTENITGSPELYIFNSNKSAHESYQEPITDCRLPLWVRDRAVREDLVITELEKQLKIASPNDVFIELSPTVFEVPSEERQKYLFGDHSFLRIHQLVVEDGQTKLLSRALRNYLDEKTQAKLFTILTGGVVSEKELLGTVGKLKPELSSINIERQEDLTLFQSITDMLYAQTPPEKRITPKDDECFATDQQINLYLNKTAPLLENIFRKLTKLALRNYDDPRLKSDITQELQRWEIFIDGLVKGKLHIDEIDHVVSQLLVSSTTGKSALINSFSDISTKERLADLQYILSQQYIPLASSCGAGSGFSSQGFAFINESFAPPRIGGKMTYDQLSSATDKLQCVTCPFCKELVDAVVGGGKITCPKCNASAQYSS